MLWDRATAEVLERVTVDNLTDLSQPRPADLPAAVTPHRNEDHFQHASECPNLRAKVREMLPIGMGPVVGRHVEDAAVHQGGIATSGPPYVSVSSLLETYLLRLSGA